MGLYFEFQLVLPRSMRCSLVGSVSARGIVRWFSKWRSHFCSALPASGALVGDIRDGVKSGIAPTGQSGSSFLVNVSESTCHVCSEHEFLPLH